MEYIHYTYLILIYIHIRVPFLKIKIIDSFSNNYEDAIR